MQIPACSCMNNYLDLLSSHLSLSLSSFFFSSEDQSGPECRSSCCRRRALLNNTLIIYRNRKVSLKRSQSNENYDITYCLFSSKRRGKFNLCCSLFFKRRHFVSSRNAGANCKFRNTTRKISEFEVFARSRKRERERERCFSFLGAEFWKINYQRQNETPAKTRAKSTAIYFLIKTKESKLVLTNGCIFFETRVIRQPRNHWTRASSMGKKSARRTHYFREDFLGFSGREPKATRVLKARYSFICFLLFLLRDLFAFIQLWNAIEHRARSNLRAIGGNFGNNNMSRRVFNFFLFSFSKTEARANLEIIFLV